MKNILILAPRLDCMFKYGIVPSVIGPIAPIRKPWGAFIHRLAQEHQRRGDNIRVWERPLWQFNANEVDSLCATAKTDGLQGWDRVYVPHKEAHEFPLTHTEAYYYAQTQFPWLFSCDTQGWGAGSSAYPFAVVPAEGAGMAFEQLQQWILRGDSKFDQPPLGTNLSLLPKDPFIFYPCQLPHDETIRFHSTVSVADALTKTLEAGHSLGIPVVVKGHPVNPGSMEPLKQITAQFSGAIWIEAVNIQDCLRLAKCVVTVNSGTGFEALLHRKPLICLGRAEYDHVCHQTTLNNLRECIYAAYPFSDALVKSFFEVWTGWCYDTNNQAAFLSIPE